MAHQKARNRRAGLERSREEVVPVKISRGDLQDSVDAGVFLDLSDEWLLLGLLENAVVRNGYSLLRTADITHVQVDTTFLPVLRDRPDWPPVPPHRAVDLSGTRELFSSFAESQDVITVHREARRPEACWLGTPTDMRRKRTWFRTADAEGRWEEVEIELRYRHITRVDFADAYTEAIATLAGPCV